MLVAQCSDLTTTLSRHCVFAWGQKDGFKGHSSRARGIIKKVIARLVPFGTTAILLSQAKTIFRTLFPVDYITSCTIILYQKTINLFTS